MAANARRVEQDRDSDHPRKVPPKKPLLNDYFLDEEGISREVLQAEICRWLGPEATCKPAVVEGQKGFKYRAIRPFTPEMLTDIKGRSREYMNENRERSHRDRQDISYEESDTRRNYDRDYGSNPAHGGGGYDRSNQYPSEGNQGYPPQNYQNPQGQPWGGYNQQQGGNFQPPPGYSGGAPGYYNSSTTSPMNADSHSHAGGGYNPPPNNGGNYGGPPQQYGGNFQAGNAGREFQGQPNYFQGGDNNTGGRGRDNPPHGYQYRDDMPRGGGGSGGNNYYDDTPMGGAPGASGGGYSQPPHRANQPSPYDHGGRGGYGQPRPQQQEPFRR